MSRPRLDPDRAAVHVVVGSGGVGKTTVAAALALAAARRGRRTLVMTFDPSRRLAEALGVRPDQHGRPVPVAGVRGGLLDAALLDARATFDHLVARYAPDADARDRILGNRFYRHLAGSLAGVLEYMAVERLYEAVHEGTYERIVLDTPPTRQALDLLEAPDRIVAFLESGALRIALRPWFDTQGRLRPAARLGPLGRNLEALLDRIVGLELLREMAEFFQAFAPLYAGFRERALEVRSLLRGPEVRFVLVTAPGSDRVADAMFFARRLVEAGHRLGEVVVNRIHPSAAPTDPAVLRWLAARDRESAGELRQLLGGAYPVVEVPFLPEAPVGLDGLAGLARHLTGEDDALRHDG